MKGNNGTGNNNERDIWETPQKLWDELNLQYNFKLDCCANFKNTKLKNNYTDKLETYGWKTTCGWMNPPFSKALLMFKHFFKICITGVAIYRCDNMETKVWQDIILKNADWVFIPKGRISYEGMAGKGSRFPSALIGKGVPKPKNLEGYSLEVYS